MVETYEEMIDRITAENPNVSIYPDLKDACIGCTESPAGTQVLVYDEEKCIEILMDGDDREGAIEWLEYNTKGTKRGVENDPMFIVPCSHE